MLHADRLQIQWAGEIVDVIHQHGYLTVKLKVQGQRLQRTQKIKQSVGSCDIAIFTYQESESGLRPRPMLMYQRPYADSFLDFLTSRHHAGSVAAHCRCDVYTLGLRGYAISVCTALDLRKCNLRSQKVWEIKSAVGGPGRCTTKQLAAINAVAAATIIIDDAPAAGRHETVWENPRDADQILSIAPYHGPFSCDSSSLKRVEKGIRLQFDKV